jgi:ABC-type methionine transport system ATPase subunit
LELIRVHGVSKSYGSAEILKDISLDVEKGEVLSVIGPTGSGKTTLLRLIDLLEEPSSGSIIFERHETVGMPEKKKQDIRKRMAMVFQKPIMFRASVRDNVSYGLKVRGLGKNKKKMSDALSAVGLSDYEQRDATTLSGGEMQRLALARAMVVEPEVLILDEPTANLDPKTASIIEGLVSDLPRSGTMVIIATHDMRQCRRLADRVAVILNGRLSEIGKTEEVFRLLPISEKLYPEGFSSQVPW